LLVLEEDQSVELEIQIKIMKLLYAMDISLTLQKKVGRRVGEDRSK